MPQNEALPQLDGLDLYGKVCLAANGISKIEVDCEADRQRICDLLLAKEQAETSGQPSASGNLHTMQPPLSSPGMKKFSKALYKYCRLPAIVASTYALDFGVVVKGTVVSKPFKMLNMCAYHGAVSVDKGMLDAFSCTLRPDKHRLPGLPERSCTELVLTLDTQAPQIVPGNVDFYLPLLVQNGPPILVNVKAYVAMPELLCDRTDLQFGTVRSGMGRIITVRLSNPGPVQAEWSLKKPADAGEQRVWNSFRCDPSSGVVAAHSHMNIKVIFIPQQCGTKKTEYSQDLSIKVSHNRTIVLNATGTSFTSMVKIWPKELDLGVMHPAGRPAVGDLQLSNPGLTPIEVIAMDFDTQWADEQRLLSEWSGYRDDWGFALLKPRGVETPLWEHVRQDVEQSRKTLTDNFGDETSVQDCAQERGSLRPHLPHSNETGQAFFAAMPIAANQTNSTESNSTAAYQRGPFVAVICSFEAGIALQQAQLLAERYSVPVTSMDHLILEAGELEHIHSDSSRVFGDMIYDELIGWEAVDAPGIQHPRPHLSMPREKRDQVVALAFQGALQQQKYNAGLVIIGTSCEFSPTAAGPLMQALDAVMGCHIRHLIDLRIDQDAAHERYLEMLSEEERTAAMGRIEAYGAMITSTIAPAAPSKGKTEAAKKAELVDVQGYPSGIDPDFGELYAQYIAGVTFCNTTGDRKVHNDGAGGLRVIKVDTEDLDPWSIHYKVIGIQFDMDAVTIELPEVQVYLSTRSETDSTTDERGIKTCLMHMQADRTRIPPPYDVQVARRPAVRAECNGRHMLALQPMDEGEKEQARWVIQPGCTVRMRLQFASEEVTDLTSRLAMMTQVGGAISEIPVRASCAYPQVNTDPQRIFPKFKRNAKPGINLRHCYIMQRGHFDFGIVPVSTELPSPEGKLDTPSIHIAVLNIENNGKFSAQVKLDLASLASEVGSTPPGGKPGKPKKVPQKPQSVFSITPNELYLEIGQADTFKVACFPHEQGPVQDTLRLSVMGNPDVSEFTIIANCQNPGA